MKKPVFPHLGKWIFTCPECENEVSGDEPRCSQCKILLDWEWLDKVYAERVVRTIQENTYSWSVVAMN